ncbi:MAG: flagellar biosynthesis protein FlhA [Kangiellaceae bacterium]|nr:flagellar biosynthesis protein FlhA [Kangiellaceae bacterium]
MQSIVQQFKEGKQDLFLVIGVVGILMALFTPIPAGMLDFLIILNFSLGLVILLLTFYTDKPLSFSTFPSMLLIATLFRLALNISATRLILVGASAGNVINAVGEFAVGGNYVIGLVVFLILIVVQYVVVTNGAQRVAEVAARFTLDSMPGKQMSIDADMNMGLIDEVEAKERRSMIEKEANFYGAMDGATKFVKGDAIAGIIIILIDIIGGLAIGVMQHNMPWNEALQTYTLLTIGDGIVTQIPSLIIATATGIIITRAASDGKLGQEVIRQITSHPKVLVIVCLALFFCLFLPGIPAFPIVILLAVFGTLAYWASKSSDHAIEDEQEDKEQNKVDDEFGDLLQVFPLEINFGKELVDFIHSNKTEVEQRLKLFRKQYAGDYGFVLPDVRIKERAEISPLEYEINIQGNRVAKATLKPDRILAINPGNKPKVEGEETIEPTFGLPAVWVESEKVNFARGLGYTIVDPLTVLLTHFSEVVKAGASSLLDRAATEELVSRIRQQHSGLIEELIPAILTYSDVQKVLQQLLDEKVSIKNISLILEAMVESGKSNKNIDFITEKVRESLGATICQRLIAEDENIHVLTVEPALERKIIKGIQSDETSSSLLLEPGVTEKILSAVAGSAEKMMGANLLPVILCTPSVRRHLKRLLNRVIPHATVLSLSEVPSTAKIRAFGVVSIGEAQNG